MKTTQLISMIDDLPVGCKISGHETVVIDRDYHNLDASVERTEGWSVAQDHSRYGEGKRYTVRFNLSASLSKAKAKRLLKALLKTIAE